MSDDSRWYKDAVIYEIHVKAFCDGDGDGIGDFAGLTQKLDYLQDLGVTALWLLPFYPSPLKDDGYDISDHFGIHPNYGSLKDFQRFLRETKRRGLRVITELVLNHTSDQHELFQRARKAPAGSPERDFYVWSDTPDKYPDARIIFKDFERSNWTWDPVAQAYYWHRFYSHQPDLNFDNPEVGKFMLTAVDFWLGMGVDGLRLDAVPYLFERDGTNCENLPETHAFLRKLRRHVDRKFKGRMLLAEANQWPEDAAAYFGAGDECHMAFHFPIMPRIFMSLHMEDCFPLTDILRQTPPIAESAQWAVFLRNHDELTLEMVTDEERDYMYRVYAVDPRARLNLGIRRRLSPLLKNHRRKIELVNGLLFSLPGTPVLYYGDEIGMGDNIYLGDRDGVRTPMQWSSDRNAGFSRSNPQKLFLPVGIDPEYHYEAVNVDVQQNNPGSLLWWVKRLIDLRKRYKAFGHGSLEPVGCDNRRILAFMRVHGEERILVVANLSRFVQFAELDLSGFRGLALVEMFGRIEFPPVTDKPYLLTLGPHSFYWFRLRLPTVPEVKTTAAPPQAETLVLEGGGDRLFGARSWTRLRGPIETHLRARRWFEGKSSPLRPLRLLDDIPFDYDDGRTAHLFLIQADRPEGGPETYVLPLVCVPAERIKDIQEAHPFCVVAAVRDKSDGDHPGSLLIDATADPAFCSALLASIRTGRRLAGTGGEVRMDESPSLAGMMSGEERLQPSLAKMEQSNTSVKFGERLMLKLFRRVEAGEHPEVELSRYLSERKSFPNVPVLAGQISYHRRGSDMTLAALHGYVANHGDAWQYTVDALRRYFDELLTAPAVRQLSPALGGSLLTLAEQEVDPMAVEYIGPFLETARLLGRRTGELHLALCGDPGDPVFGPEGFSALYQRSLYQSLRNRMNETLYHLRQRLGGLPETQRQRARLVLDKEGEILKRFHGLIGAKLTGQRIRVHGDYHLKQVLCTGTDFSIFDFEGPSDRSVTERRIKRSPLCDVAGMVRSMHFAAYAVLLGWVGVARVEDEPFLDPWARFWCQWTSSSFIRSYLKAVDGASFLPKSRPEMEFLMGVLLLERAVGELRYTLNIRPDWAVIPAEGILQLVETKP